MAAEKLTFSWLGPALQQIGVNSCLGVDGKESVVVAVGFPFCLSCATFNSLASISEASVIGAVPQIKQVLIGRHFSFLASPQVPVEWMPLGGWSVEGFFWKRFPPRPDPFSKAHRWKLSFK